MEVKLSMGEKLKDLRIERRLTTKKLCEETGISEAVYNGMENDSNRDVGYSRIIALAKYFDVPTDYLLGFTESRITKNLEIKQFNLTDKAIESLMSGRQNNYVVSDILEHAEFANLINSIDVYIRQLAAPHINTVNNMLKIAQHGLENYYSQSKPKPDDFDNAMTYINETVVDEDDFLRFRISERFNQILRDTFTAYQKAASADIPKRIDSTNEMTSNILEVLDDIKSGGRQINSVEDAIFLMAEKMGIDIGETADELVNYLDYVFSDDDNE